jgi:hypothetical protein
MSDVQKISVNVSYLMDKSSKSEVNNIKESTNKLSWSNNYLGLKNRNVMLDKSSVKMFFLHTIKLIILFGAIGCGGPNYSKSRAEYMEENINKIKINMTKQELKNIFGEPDYYAPKVPFFYDGGSLEKAHDWTYIYPDNGFAHQIHFDPHTGRVIKSEKIGVGMGFL